MVKEAEKGGKPKEKLDRVQGLWEDTDKRIEVKRRMEKMIFGLEEELRLLLERLRRIEGYVRKDFRYSTCHLLLGVLGNRFT
jgi:hypothetical protein